MQTCLVFGLMVTSHTSGRPPNGSSIKGGGAEGNRTPGHRIGSPEAANLPAPLVHKTIYLVEKVSAELTGLFIFNLSSSPFPPISPPLPLPQNKKSETQILSPIRDSIITVLAFLILNLAASRGALPPLDHQRADDVG